MTDIVERLLVQSELGLLNLPEDHIVVSWDEAADEIERLREENARLKADMILVRSIFPPNLNYKVYPTSTEQTND